MESSNSNDLTGYVNSVNIPGNPYSSGAASDPAFMRGGEYRQYNSDMSMAKYNAQIHESELLKQRQWALEDRDYNSPSAARARLEAAGYNPSLMSGIIATANQPVRASTANSPGGSMSNMSAYSSAQNQAVGNLINAGQSIVSSMVSGKQMQDLDASINLKNSQSVKTLAESAKTDQDRRFASDLFSTQKQVLEQDLANKKMDWSVSRQQVEQVVPAQLARLSKENQLSDSQIFEIAKNVEFKGQITSANIREINQAIKESSQRILQSQQTINNLVMAETNGWIDVKKNIVSAEVQKATKYADIVKPYTDIVTEGISNAIGISKAGSAAKSSQAMVNWSKK